MSKTLLTCTLLFSVGLLSACFPSPNREGGIVDRMIDKAIDQAKKENEADKRSYSLDQNNSIKAEDLINAYDGNQIRADNEFKDKEFEVIGKITKIETDVITEMPVIELAGSGFLEFMQCHFDDYEGLDMLNIGDVVRISGICVGKDVLVEMEQCTVINVR